MASFEEEVKNEKLSEEKRWCCFWDSDHSNLLAVAVHCIIASIVCAGQCFGVMMFALVWVQVSYVRPPNPESATVLVPKGSLPPGFVSMNVPDSQADLYRRFLEYTAKHPGKPLSKAMQAEIEALVEASQVLTTSQKDAYLYSSLIMFAAVGLLFVSSGLVFFASRKPNRIALLFWLICDAVFISIDVVYHLFLVYTFLTFHNIDMVAIRTWFHFITALYIIVFFVRESFLTYSYMFIKHYRENLATSYSLSDGFMNISNFNNFQTNMRSMDSEKGGTPKGSKGSLGSKRRSLVDVIRNNQYRQFVDSDTSDTNIQAETSLGTNEDSGITNPTFSDELSPNSPEILGPTISVQDSEKLNSLVLDKAYQKSGLFPNGRRRVLPQVPPTVIRPDYLVASDNTKLESSTTF